MKTFIKKCNVRVEEQADAFDSLMHLRGQCNDVVRFGTRKRLIDVNANPDTIFGILRKHFRTQLYLKTRKTPMTTG